MQRVIREKAVDRSSYVAYAGAGAAIAFIAAMTFGAIDAPSQQSRQWTAAPSPEQSTQIVSASAVEGAASVQ